MWNGKTITVIFPTYNEKDSIRAAIEELFAAGFVDEVLVVNNNAAPGTSEEVAKTRAREDHRAAQGYGRAIRPALEQASGELPSSPSRTARSAGDVVKLLAYAADFEYVLGTRTTREMIWEGANMGIFLKWGNWAVAKMAEFLFNSTILTDCGCTLRLIARPTYEKLRPYFTAPAATSASNSPCSSSSTRSRSWKSPSTIADASACRASPAARGRRSSWAWRMIAMVLKFRLGMMGKKPGKGEDD